jgi:hypothetical protein
MAGSRREEALRLAEELLSDIELTRIARVDVVRRASRLARLIDDEDAMRWLRYEIGGYPVPLDPESVAAAERSSRRAPDAEDGGKRWWTNELAGLQASVEAALAELSTNSGTSSSQMAYPIEREKAARRTDLMLAIRRDEEIIQRVIGAIHAYVAERYQELRFGSAVETAFEVVRADVDAKIADLVPDALPKLSAAFENATSDNPEDWASAAATCRRLLKAVADALRPPGDPVDGRLMTDAHFINRLVDWVVQQSESETARDMIVADLDYLGRRLDAVADAGHKGAHDEVGRFDASRFVTGTYLLLGDVLRLRASA